jgi:hypothetical protein
MNLTLGNTFPRTWKRLGVQHVVAAAASAVALTVALAAGLALTSNPGSSTKTGSAATNATISTRAAPSDLTYYIVGSQEEAARMEEGMAIAALEVSSQSGYQTLGAERAVPMIIETAEQQMQFQAQLMALQQLDPYWSSVRVVDLRR